MVMAGLNLTEPVIPGQLTVASVAIDLGAPAPALPPTAAMKPSGMAVAAAINNNLRSMMCSLFSSAFHGD